MTQGDSRGTSSWMDGIRSRPTVIRWPLWCAERVGWNDGRFPRDKLLDGRDMIPSYGDGGRLWRTERGGG